jgi:hypothetical protein
MNKKIISIMPLWDEQNMVGLSIASTKEIVYQYIVLIQNRTKDKTREVVEYCKKLWNLNMIIIETDLKLREMKKYAIEISKQYADYYLLQDGDEIFFSNTNAENNVQNILHLIQNGITFGYTSIVLLEKDLLHTSSDESRVWIVPHPFFFKNTKDIYWLNQGDSPSCNANLKFHKIYGNNHFKKIPFKFDAKIKNFRRSFLRDVFTQWHDNEDFKGSIEEYADLYHPTVLWYRENINKKLTLEEIIEKYELWHKENQTTITTWYKKYDEKEYVEYPYIIKKFIEFGKIKGIESLDDLKYLDLL